MRKSSFSGPGGVYESTSLGFFCDLEAKLAFVSELVYGDEKDIIIR